MTVDPVFAQQPSTDANGCAGDAAVHLRACTDKAAREIAGEPAWLACQGGCIVRQIGADAAILDLRGQVMHDLAGLRFLPGNGRTDCLVALPFVSVAGELVILDAPTGEPLSRQPLAPFYAVDFTAEPDLLNTIAELGQLSCDGKRFFAPSLDGTGFAVLDPATPFPEGGADQSDTNRVIAISPTGNHVLSITSGGDGHYHLQGFDGGPVHRIDAVFELDTVFFDVTERYLLIRRGSDPHHAEVLELPDGRSIGKAPLTQEMGLDLRVMGQNDVLRLVSVYPPPDE